ncbi:hypothetical protein ACEWY4_013756 [Coilia grayii]|uniref:PiggyBac transposable element-derived protein domain-containing protein n=1 Tax=Coilia grayii TaxID=363190 RepID=A0ABD1JX93_9TELE
MSRKWKTTPILIQTLRKLTSQQMEMERHLRTHSSPRVVTARWPVEVFHNILSVSACNAYVVWTAINPTWNQEKCLKRRLFLAGLGNALVTPLIQRRQRIPHTPASVSLVRSAQAPASALAALPQQGQGHKRRRCELCGLTDSKPSRRRCKCDGYCMFARPTLT